MKIYIKTSDVFNHCNEELNRRWFEDCYRKAIKCGIECYKSIDKNGFIVLNLKGSKLSLVKYYLLTLLNTSNKLVSIEILFSIITT